MIRTISLSSAADAAYVMLKDAILRGELGLGSQLDLSAIERKMGLSRTPVKDAIGRLERDGLVQIIPRHGTFIASPTTEELEQSFDVRLALEWHAAALVVKHAKESELLNLRGIVGQLRELINSGIAESDYARYVELDMDFHRAFVAVAGNPRLLKAHEAENVHLQMARIRHGEAEVGLEQAQQEHEQIIDAALARDLTLTQFVVAAHIRRACSSLLADMDESSRRDAR